MKHPLIIGALAAIISSSAFAQYAQPIRDIDKDARSIVTGTCGATVTVGQGTGSNNCILTIQDAQVDAVPAGKVLVVDDTSAQCGVQSGQLLRFVQLGGASYQKELSLLLQLTSPSGTRYYSNTFPTHFYVSAGSVVRLRMTMDQSVTSGTAYCLASFAGHLVSAQ